MAGRKIIWSPRAKIDQFEILDYFYKRNGNKKYSQKLYKEFKKAINLLIKHSDIGIRTDINNVRNLIVNNYAIFYRKDKDSIEIITIWDCSQDPEKLDII
jgi:plasmid stabilization system protein ParE